ncbi:PD-(D/E)XK nuclease family transposase [Blautia sp. MSJ-19]|uniref:PD-(D/E)XK nuclease family transposase n=1 Tax=Blautia sp. MSJ-19 TaxID=2841517 RepID=UPI001C0EB89B|nr:PD-(D/E)XK nuclease family transposase [Blautia sp. MSJ-19]MBU5480529.1 PD-(D/E)XK nuclease family transposase [Blautia sp. MSJ-19]
MQTKLQKYFPMLRSREEILKDIDANVKLTEQLFLSILFKRKVKIVEVLPGDSSRLADEQSLLLMDILVRFEDGTYCNIEVQKIGYAFPGERCACYSSDLLLRQYKRARSAKKNKFTYKDVKGVYTIVLMEKSPALFHKYADDYVHTFSQKADTGLEMDLLQKYIFIPLDIFHKNVQNRGVKNKMDAWLTFLGSDEPEEIINLLRAYPEFSTLYEHVYYICRNVEDVMGIFSEELKILDQNTVKYMVDQMQEQIDEQREQIDEQKEQIGEQRKQLSDKEEQLREKDCEIQQIRKDMETLKRQMESFQKK